MAKHCGKTEVKEGEFIEVDIDVLLGNDITAPLAIEKFREWGGKRVFDSQKIVLVPDHSTPNKDIRAPAGCTTLICIFAFL